MRTFCVIMLLLSGCTTVGNVTPFNDGITLQALSIDGKVYEARGDEISIEEDRIVLHRDGKEIASVKKDAALGIIIINDGLIKRLEKEIDINVHKHENKQPEGNLFL